MALWMEEGAEPVTESEKADIDAITALKESAAIELKEKGNWFVKAGKKHYNDAIDCYTRAINQKISSKLENSILLSNRSHVHLLLGNYRHALSDAEEAINLSSENIKGFYRAAKAAFFLNLLNEAKEFCQRGLEKLPSNEELKKLASQISSKQAEFDLHETRVSEAVAAAQDLAYAFQCRGLKLGVPVYQELTGPKKPTLDSNDILHWPVLLLYAEVMSSDLIEDFCELDLFSTHLDIMFSDDCSQLTWDRDRAYVREAVELYYESGIGCVMSRGMILQYLLEGSVAAKCAFDEDENQNQYFSSGERSRKWERVDEKQRLCRVLQQADFIIPGIPVFYVISRSSFCQKFKLGKCALP